MTCWVVIAQWIIEHVGVAVQILGALSDIGIINGIGLDESAELRVVVARTVILEFDVFIENLACVAVGYVECACIVFIIFIAKGAVAILLDQITTGVIRVCPVHF